jgi:TonB family protein
MQKLSAGALVAAAFLVCRAVPSLAQNSFKPAEVISATDIQYPIRSIADGVVVLDVSLDGKGAVTGSTVVRDILSLTSVATASIQSWKFTPASQRGRPVPSIIRVAIVFRPPAYLAAGPGFIPILSEGDSNQIGSQEYIPPGIVSATYPQYPMNAAIPGTVIIQVTVGKSSSIENLKVVRDLRPFTQFALGAANKWRFQAATLKGQQRTSNLAIAFIFTPPVSNN